MNALLKQYATPVVVLGIALYLGWPTASPVDYGADVVRAKAVRWRPDDLRHPPTVDSDLDPFREVLVTSGETVVEPETGKLVAPSKPTGPAAWELKSGLRISGIANMGGRKWAIINGKPRLPGDKVNTDDAKRHSCEVVSVESDHVIVRCEATTVTIRPGQHALAPPSSSTAPVPAMDATTQPSSSEQIPPPPAI